MFDNKYTQDIKPIHSLAPTTSTTNIRIYATYDSLIYAIYNICFNIFSPKCNAVL